MCKNNLTKTACLTIVLICFTFSPVTAAVISIDADDYPDGTDISTAFPGITLSSVGDYTGLDGLVYAWGDALASTSTNVFANNLSYQRQWHAGITDVFALRADFAYPADSVAIDIIGDDQGDIGVLYAYGAADNLLESVTSHQLQYGEVFTAVIERASFDIKYIIAGGAADNTVHLDNLAANVPEPASLVLLSLGALLLRKSRNNTPPL